MEVPAVAKGILLLDQWEGLGKGAASRSAWEGAMEVEGLEGGRWRDAVGGGGSDEDESEDVDDAT